MTSFVLFRTRATTSPHLFKCESSRPCWPRRMSSVRHKQAPARLPRAVIAACRDRGGAARGDARSKPTRRDVEGCLEGEDAAGGTGMTARRAYVPEEHALDAAAAAAAAAASSVRCCCESRPPRLLLDAEAAAGWGQAQAGILSHRHCVSPNN